MKNKMRMIKAAIGVRCVSCFVGPPPTFLASPATLNLFDNPEFMDSDVVRARISQTRYLPTTLVQTQNVLAVDWFIIGVSQFRSGC